MGEGVPDFPGWDAGGYIFRCFLAFCSGRFLGVVFRVSRDVFLAFGCLLGSPAGSPGRHFLQEFRQFSDFGGGSESMAGVMF